MTDPALIAHASALLAALPAAAAALPGRPPGPTESIGLELTRLLLATAAATGRVPWHAAARDLCAPRPVNALTRNPATGINALIHLVLVNARGIAAVTATERQWLQLGAAIHPGQRERPVPAVYYKQIDPLRRRAIPQRTALYDVSQVEFASTMRAHQLAVTSSPTPARVRGTIVMPASEKPAQYLP